MENGFLLFSLKDKRIVYQTTIVESDQTNNFYEETFLLYIISSGLFPHVRDEFIETYSPRL